MSDKKSPRCCGYAAVIGAPNAGKSTLLNALTGSAISIVSPKPQTTRGRVRGVVCEGGSQIIFVDTPGIFDAKPSFEKAMVEAAWSGVGEADAVLLLIDAERRISDNVRRIIESLKKRKQKTILVLNKVDKVDRHQLPELAQELHALLDFERSFMISALLGDGVKDILKYLAGRMPEAPWLYPEDEMTDMPERQLAEEITREQCFLKLHAELPYGVMVETEKWEEKGTEGKRVLRIHQNIITERESHKKMILGKGGVMLKAIGSVARRKAGEMLGAEVHLFLFVKVREKWKDDPQSFLAAGLEYKK
jgi:GTP-binding protein Era